MAKLSNSVWVALTALLIAMVSIQSGAAIAHALFPQVGVAGAATLRLIFASLMLCVVWRPWRTKISKEATRLVIGYGAALGSMNLLFYCALARVPLGIAVAIEFTGPLLLAIAMSRQPIDFLWVILAAFGILLLLPRGSLDSPIDTTGALFALAAGACWVVYILCGHKVGKALPHGQASALGMLIAALCVTPFGIASAGHQLLNWSILPVALAVGFLSSALPYSLEMIALARVSPRVFGILLSLEPALAALAGLPILNEHLSGRQWLAIVAVMVASLGTSVAAGRRTNSNDAPLQSADASLHE